MVGGDRSEGAAVLKEFVGSDAMAVKTMFYQKPSCTTCRKAKAFLIGRKIQFTSRDLDKERLTEEELDALIGKRDHIPFLNTRNELYRQRKMKENPPTRKQAIEWMAKEPNLIKRPLVVRGAKILFGFDEAGYREL